MAASAAALSLLVLAGCGGGDDSADDSSQSSSSTSTAASSPADDSSAESTEESTDEADSGVAEGTEISAEEFGGLVQSALDQATTSNVTVSSSTGGLEGTGQIDYDADPAELKMSATSTDAGKLEMVLIGTTIYIKGDAFGTDKWVEISLDDPNSPFAALGGQLDPAASLEKLVKGVQTATFVGEEDVDGESLEHYTATVDTATLLEDVLPPEAQGSIDLPPTVDYQMYFDGDGFIRKFSVDMGATVGTSEGTFDDWGTEVDIEAPPASEITTMPGM